MYSVTMHAYTDEQNINIIALGLPREARQYIAEKSFFGTLFVSKSRNLVPLK